MGSTQQGQSKSFVNYLKARERQEANAIVFVEKQNKLALQKVKNKTLADKAAKEQAAFSQAQKEKIHEKQ